MEIEYRKSVIHQTVGGEDMNYDLAKQLISSV